MTEDKPKEGEHLSTSKLGLRLPRQAWIDTMYWLLWLSVEAFGLVASEMIIKVTFWLLEKIRGTPFPLFVEAIVSSVVIFIFLALVLVTSMIHMTQLGDAFRKGWQEYIERQRNEAIEKKANETVGIVKDSAATVSMPLSDEEQKP